MKILLVDLWNVFHVMWHAGTNQYARWPFDNTMGRCRTLAKDYDHCAFMADGGKSFRRELDSRWKANREEKAAGLFAQLGEVERQLDAEGFHVFKVPEFEADDLIASAVQQLMRGYVFEPAQQADISITINSSDRDLYSLLEPGVVMLTTVEPHRVVQAENLRQSKKVGVDPPKIRDFLVLSDKHNGVKYFDGIGPVNAAALLNEHGDLKTILSKIDNRVPDSDQFEIHPPSVRASIKKAISEMVDGRPLIDVAMQIVTLRTDAPIDIKTIFTKREPKAQAETAWEDGNEPNASVDSRGHEASQVGEEPANQTKERPTVVASVGEEPVGESEGKVQSVGTSVAQGSAPLVVAPRWELALEPIALQDAWRLAHRATESGFWQKHGGPAGAMMIIMAGRSRGLTAFDALNGMHIIEGKPVFGAYLLIGMVQRDKRCAYFELVESDEKHAKWITKRKGSKIEQSRVYTIEQATKAELNRPTHNGKASNWMKHPEDMLIKTAGAKLTRAAWADITSGAVAAEEMGYE